MNELNQSLTVPQCQLERDGDTANMTKYDTRLLRPLAGSSAQAGMHAKAFWDL